MGEQFKKMRSSGDHFSKDNNWHVLRFLVRQDYVRLLRAKAIVEWPTNNPGVKFPRRQDLPQTAFADENELDFWAWGTNNIVTFSYSWLHPDHPDPGCFHVERMSKVLATLRQETWRDLCVFWDWGSLPQKPRTNEETAIFGKALNLMQVWYGGYYPYVVELMDVPREAYNGTPYKDRGWCTFESQLANSKAGCPVYGVSDNNIDDFGRWRANLGLPMVPERFEQVLATAKFTTKADKGKVCELYRTSFEMMSSTSYMLHLTNRGINDEDLDVFAAALPHYKVLYRIDFEGNEGITAAGKQ